MYAPLDLRLVIASVPSRSFYCAAVKDQQPGLTGAAIPQREAAKRGCPSVLLELRMDEMAEEIRKTFFGPVSGPEACRYSPEREGRSGGGTDQGRAKVEGMRVSDWAKPFLAGTQPSSNGPRELGLCHCEPPLSG